MGGIVELRVNSPQSPIVLTVNGYRQALMPLFLPSKDKPQTVAEEAEAVAQAEAVAEKAQAQAEAQEESEEAEEAQVKPRRKPQIRGFFWAGKRRGDWRG